MLMLYHIKPTVLFGCADRPQLMMYVDGEFVWIPASRVPEALNFILVWTLFVVRLLSCRVTRVGYCQKHTHTQ